MHPSPAGVYNSKDAWPLPREIASQSRLGDRSEFREHNLVPATSVLATNCESGRTGNCQNSILVICEKYAGKLPCVRVKKSWRQTKKQRRVIMDQCQSGPASNTHGVSTWLFGSNVFRNTFVHVRACAFGLDWGSHLLAVSCGFFDGTSHSISVAWTTLNDLGTNPRLQLCLTTSTARWERHLFRA